MPIVIQTNWSLSNKSWEEIQKELQYLSWKSEYTISVFAWAYTWIVKPSTVVLIFHTRIVPAKIFDFTKDWVSELMIHFGSQRFQKYHLFDMVLVRVVSSASDPVLPTKITIAMVKILTVNRKLKRKAKKAYSEN